MKRWVSCFLLAVWLAGCRPGAGGLTPETAVHQQIIASGRDLVDLCIYGRRTTPEGQTVVIYSYFAPKPGERVGTYFTGYYEVESSSLGLWRATSGGGGGSNVKPTEGQLVDYVTTTGDYTAIYGIVTSQRVSAVEGILDNGEIVRDEAGDFAFALFSPRAVTICSVRVLGEDGEVLKWKEFPSGNSNDPCLGEDVPRPKP